MRRETARILLGAALTAVALCIPAEAYYHYVHLSASDGVWSAAYQKFDVSALPAYTVSVYVSSVGPRTAGSFPIVLGQVRQAAEVWDSVPQSELRVAFGGLQAQNQRASTPGIDVIFTDELPPGVLADAASTAAIEPVTRGGSVFYPVTGAVIRLNSNTDVQPGPAYTDGYFFTALHEMGHALGLQHSFTASAMSQAVIRNTARTRPLENDDIAAFLTLYGKAGWNQAFGSISGRIRSNGQGVFMASVVALPVAGSPVSALTAPDGTYRIDGIPPGQYLLYVHPLPPGADVTAPLDGNGHPIARTGSVFETVFFPATGVFEEGTRDLNQVVPVSVEAGKTSAGRNVSVQQRAALPVYDLITYSYYDPEAQAYSYNGFPLTPAFVDSAQTATDGIGTMVIQAKSMVTPVPLTATIIGGFPKADVRKWGDAVVLYFGMPRVASTVGPRHLVLDFGSDMYVLPHAVHVVDRKPPEASSVRANEDGSVTVSGRLSNDSRIFFDGMEAVASKPVEAGEESSSITVVPPPGVSRQSAAIVAYNSDGQSSLTLDSANLAFGSQLRYPPPAYDYPELPSPQAAALPAALPAGALAKIEIDAADMRFEQGRATVGLGSHDVSVRKVWALSPSRLLANISVSPRAEAGTTEFSVISGFRVATQPNGFQIQPARPSMPSIQSVVNGIPTQATIYPGAYISIFGANLAVDGAAHVTLNDQAVRVEYASPTQINVVTAEDLKTGPAILKLNNGSEDAFALAVEIASPPPSVVRVAYSMDQALDASRPAAPGERLDVFVTRLDQGVLTDRGRLRLTLGEVAMDIEDVSEAENGVNRIQVIVPVSPGGAQPLAVWVDGSSSPAVMVPVLRLESAN